MVEIIPAVIPNDLSVVEEKFSKVIGLVKKVQVDFVDGVYAPPKSWPWSEGGEESFSKIFLGEEKFPFIDEFAVEADMLVKEPEEMLKKLLPIGFKGFVIHMDSTDSLHRCIDMVKDAKLELGLGLKPSGSMEKLENFLQKCDFVQFMGNDHVGYNKVELDPLVLDRVADFRSKHPEMPIQIDIGVNFDTAPQLIAAGATRLISGSAIFESDIGVAAAIEKLKNS